MVLTPKLCIDIQAKKVLKRNCQLLKPASNPVLPFQPLGKGFTLHCSSSFNFVHRMQRGFPEKPRRYTIERVADDSAQPDR